MAREDMKARERVLYVGISDPGAPMTPNGVSEAESRSWVSGMVAHFVRLGAIWRGSLDDDLAKALGGEV
jgi:hypothetical protein